MTDDTPALLALYQATPPLGVMTLTRDYDLLTPLVLAGKPVVLQGGGLLRWWGGDQPAVTVIGAVHDWGWDVRDLHLRWGSDGGPGYLDNGGTGLLIQNVRHGHFEASARGFGTGVEFRGDGAAGACTQCRGSFDEANCRNSLVTGQRNGGYSSAHRLRIAAEYGAIPAGVQCCHLLLGGSGDVIEYPVLQAPTGARSQLARITGHHNTLVGGYYETADHETAGHVPMAIIFNPGAYSNRVRGWSVGDFQVDDQSGIPASSASANSAAQW